MCIHQRSDEGAIVPVRGEVIDSLVRQLLLWVWVMPSGTGMTVLTSNIIRSKELLKSHMSLQGLEPRGSHVSL